MAGGAMGLKVDGNFFVTLCAGCCACVVSNSQTLPMETNRTTSKGWHGVRPFF